MNCCSDPKPKNFYRTETKYNIMLWHIKKTANLNFKFTNEVLQSEYFITMYNHVLKLSHLSGSIRQDI